MLLGHRAAGRMALLLLTRVLLAGCAEPPVEPCYDDVECEDGFCYAGSCVARLGRGEDCGRLSAYDGSGLAKSNCKIGLVCSSLSRLCEPPAPLGARCGDDGDCGAHPGYRSADAPICDPGADPPRCAAPRTIPAGGACLGDRACAGDLRCRKNTDGSSTCRGPGAEGDRCEHKIPSTPESVPQCMPGLYCGHGSPAVCRTHAGLEESCVDSECEEGLVCRRASRQCGYPSAVTGACDGDDDCAGDLICLVGSCAARSTTGAACGARDHCAVAGDVCVLGVCAAPSVDGRPCASSDDCASGLRCEMGTYAASASRKVGEPCQSRYACKAPGICLDDVCRYTGGPGETCGSANDCRAGLFCQSDVCVWRRPDGAPCTSDSECRSSFCAWIEADDAPSGFVRACGPAQW